VKFSTWGFKVLSGIGKRAATIEDRSIIGLAGREAGDPDWRHLPVAAPRRDA
jgi:hypothetical protein